MKLDFNGLDSSQQRFLLAVPELIGVYEERAAIYEFEAKRSRDYANKSAYYFCWQLYKKYRKEVEEGFYGTKRS